MAESSTRVVRCPACGGKSVYAPENPHRPFCSARCRQNDFGGWATEGYRIAQREGADEADVEPSPVEPARR
jgi:endogenous inhibitor of DNA gyrase (YacG/DUF329 family)